MFDTESCQKDSLTVSSLLQLPKCRFGEEPLSALLLRRRLSLLRGSLTVQCVFQRAWNSI